MPPDVEIRPCEVCGGTLSPVYMCRNCGGKHPMNDDFTVKTWVCANCKQSAHIQFMCEICATRFLYEEVVIGHGAKPKEEKKLTCPKCRIELVPEEQTCLKCGYDLSDLDIDPSKRHEVKRPVRRLKGDFDENDVIEIAKIPGIGRKQAELLCKAGYNELSKIKKATEKEIFEIPGIGAEYARRIKAATSMILVLPPRLSKEDIFKEEKECRKCSLPTPIFSKKCLECGGEFEDEEIDESVKSDFERDGIDAIVEFYGQATKRRSNDPQLWYALALSLNASERYDAANRALRKARKLKPDDSKFTALAEKLDKKLGVKEPPAEVTEKIIEASKPTLPPESPREKPKPPPPPEIIEEVKCPNCNKATSSTFQFCPSCGNSLKEEKRPKIRDRIEEGEFKRVLTEIETLSEEPVEEAPEATAVESPPGSQQFEIHTKPSPVEFTRLSKRPSRRPMLNGHGLVNGKGRVNGLINGNGFVNGVEISDVWLPRSSTTHRYVAIAVAVITIFLILNSLLQIPAGPSRMIQIDGNFADWEGVGSYSDVDPTFNPNVNLTSYALKLDGDMLFFKAEVEGILFDDTLGYDGLYIFLDTDSDNSTGYFCGSLGADYMISVEGTNASISASSLMGYRGQDRTDWNRWSMLSGVRTASVGGSVEGEVGISIISNFDSGSMLARFLMDDQQGNSSWSSTVIGVEYGSLKVTQRSLTQILSTGPTDFLELTFELTGSSTTLRSEDIVIYHTTGTQIDGIPSEITLTESRAVLLAVRIYAGFLAEGSVVEAHIESITADRPVTVHGNSARAYVLTAPTDKRIDGLFADWPSPRIDYDSLPLSKKSVDIEAYDSNVTGSTAFFYLRTVEQTFKGTAAPLHKQKSLAPPGGGGITRPPPRVTGENVARAYIDTDPATVYGFYIEGIRAKYMMEATGTFGNVLTLSTYRWEGRWVIFSGTPQLEKHDREAEMSMTIAGVNLYNATYVIRTTDWRGIGDETVVAGTKGDATGRTRGTEIILMGSSSLLYATPTLSAPTIDGDWSSTEWQDADYYDTGDIIVYTMQDGTYLYVCIRVKSDTVYNAGDYAEVAFDTDNGDESAPNLWDKKFDATDPDGSTVNEDYNGTGSGWDSSYVSPYTWSANGDQDTDDGNYITYEFRIEFPEVWNTSSPSSGQIAGFAVHVHDDDGAGSDYYWGSNDLNDPSTFGNLQIPEFEEIVIVLVLVPVIMIVLYKSGKNNKPRRH